MKAELRTTADAFRQNLDMVTISQAIGKQLADWSVFQDASVILAYSALPTEVSLHDLMKDFPQKQWFLPHILDDKTMAFHRYQLGDALKANRFGILEPLNTSPLWEPTDNPLIFVPALLVDTHGNRLGFGKGYYDRFLADVSVATLVTPIAQQMIVDTLPADPWDIRMHYAVTEDRVFLYP